MIDAGQLSNQDLKVLHAALCVMVKDVHTMADALDENDCNRAETILDKVDRELNLRNGHGRTSSF
jgi:hypothetical protein